MHQRLAPTADVLPPRLARRFWMAFGVGKDDGLDETHLGADDAATHVPEDGNEAPMGALPAGGPARLSGESAARGEPTGLPRWHRAARSGFGSHGGAAELEAEALAGKRVHDSDLLGEDPAPPAMDTLRDLLCGRADDALAHDWCQLAQRIESWRQRRAALCEDRRGVMAAGPETRPEDLLSLSSQLDELIDAHGRLAVQLRTAPPTLEQANLGLLLAQVARFLKSERQRLARLQRCVERQQAMLAG